MFYQHRTRIIVFLEKEDRSFYFSEQSSLVNNLGLQSENLILEKSDFMEINVVLHINSCKEGVFKSYSRSPI